MNRRNFLGLLAAVPGLGFLKPEKSPKIKLTVGDYGTDDFGSVPVSHKRVGIVECSTLCLPQIVECAKLSGCVIYRTRLVFDRDVVEVKMIGEQFDPVPEACVIPRYTINFPSQKLDNPRFTRIT